jgi:hypothetical protein
LKKPDGGPAFPFGTKVTRENYMGEETVYESNVPGVTLRQYYAAAALKGVLANPECRGTFQELAVECFNMADWMIAVEDAEKQS